MKLFSANLKDLRELYVNSLQKALDMEQKITEALPKMIEKSTDSQLADAFRTHLEETRGHVSKVENILRSAQNDTDTITCKPVAALITEAQDMIKDSQDPSVRDVALIAAGQQVEHHEMAVYGTLRNWAEILGESEQASVLEQILEEEKHADEVLTDLSDRVNTTAESTATGTESNITGMGTESDRISGRTSSRTAA